VLAEITGTLAHVQANVLDISQKMIEGYFHMIVTVELPLLAFHVFGPQHVECVPGSVTRNACLLFTDTVGEPLFAGPWHVCAQHGLPCESFGILALSPTRPWGCILWLPSRRHQDWYQALLPSPGPHSGRV
jgi:hypothetical protein